jgi:hypothetical protein
MGSTKPAAYTAPLIPALFEPSAELIEIRSGNAATIIPLCFGLFEIVGQHAALLQRMP